MIKFTPTQFRQSGSFNSDDENLYISKVIRGPLLVKGRFWIKSFGHRTVLNWAFRGPMMEKGKFGSSPLGAPVRLNNFNNNKMTKFNFFWSFQYSTVHFRQCPKAFFFKTYKISQCVLISWSQVLYHPTWEEVSALVRKAVSSLLEQVDHVTCAWMGGWRISLVSINSIPFQARALETWGIDRVSNDSPQ